MDGFDPLDPNNYLSNTLPIHTAVSNDDYNNYLPTLGMTGPSNDYAFNYPS